MTTDQLLARAVERHRAGDLSEARQRYEQVLANTPENYAASFCIGLLELQAGRPEAALPRIEQAVAGAPNESRYLFGLGEALRTLGRWKKAAAAYQRVLDADPGSADAQYALGMALQSSGDYRGAIDAYEAAVRLRPNFPDAFNNLGNCHQLLGDFRVAEASYRHATELRPNDAGATSNLGIVLEALGRVDEAIKVLHDAIDIEPTIALHAVNLGAVLCRQRKFSQAVDVLQGAIARDPKNADAAYNLGTALAGAGKQREAAEQYRTATKLRPSNANAFINLGNIHKELGEFALAKSAYESAIDGAPDSVVALNNLGCLLRTLAQLEEAQAVFRRGLAINPRHAALHNNLGNALKDSGQLDEAIDCFRKAVAVDPADAGAHSNLCYSLSFSAADGKQILDECLRWNTRHASPLLAGQRVHFNDRTPDRRLRIGYVSPDFRDHCQSLFTIPLLSHHDHAGFEILCYSCVERPDTLTSRIAGYADIWRDVRLLDDSALCDLIRADQIDVLVDLTMHMGDSRPLVFARKPAPVQIAWLAYPGTTGIATIDFRLSDPRLDPPEMDNQYSERTIRLPDSFWCYDPLSDQPAVSPLPALSRGTLTLGCLNNPCKLTDASFQLWGAVLRALPAARLVLMIPSGTGRQRALTRLSAEGVAPGRVEFLSYRPRAEYLCSYNDIDLGLDTLPYNGHTTSLDAFWMGVPVVTRIGPTCVGRAGLSQLFQLDLLELAAETDDSFVQSVIALGNDLPRLTALRQQLRGRLKNSPLMNAGRFSRNIERAYRQAFAEWCASPRG